MTSSETCTIFDLLQLSEHASNLFPQKKEEKVKDAFQQAQCNV